VTLNFLANGGDGYPIKTLGENFRFLLSDGGLSAPVDPAKNFTALDVVPANALGEQQAFREYMQEFHATAETAFSRADTSAAFDERVQNLDFRADTVLAGLETQPCGSPRTRCTLKTRRGRAPIRILPSRSSESAGPGATWRSRSSSPPPPRPAPTSWPAARCRRR
jgi:hypothetical protein